MHYRYNYIIEFTKKQHYKNALNIAEVEYISSAGLRVLLLAQKTMAKKGGMKLSMWTRTSWIYSRSRDLLIYLALSNVQFFVL